MSDPIRVLHVEDDADLASLAADSLPRENGRIQVSTVTDPSAAVRAFREARIDCVVSEYDMPGTDGLEVLAAVRAVDETVPFVLFTGEGSEEVASDALGMGATDYLRKEAGADGFARLANRIETAVDRRRSVAELERENDLLMEAQSIADLGVCEYDLESGELWYSGGIADPFDVERGWMREEVDLARALEYVHPDDRETVEAAVERTVESGEASDFEARLDGDEERWLRVRCEPTVEGGEVRRLRATVRDVTERVAREREMESRERIMERIGLGVYALDAAGEYTYVNPAGERITGYDAADILDGGPALLHPEGDLETFEATIAELVREGPGGVRTVEATIRTRGGEEIPVDVTLTVLTSGDGSYAGSVGVARDVTQRKETERRLREYESILRAIPDEVSIVDDEGHHVELIPPPGQELTDSGYRPGEVRGEHISKVMRDEDVERAGALAAELVTTDREHVAFEMDVVTADGELLPRENHMALLEDDDGSIRGTVSVLRDVAERKAHERELERQNERLERFAEIASHDLRNPLNVARGHLELARDESDSEHLPKIDDAIERMGRLIDDTLAMARQGASVEDPTTIDLAEHVPACWEAVGSDAADLTVVDPVTIRADETRARQVVENLLRNAVEHGSTSPPSRAREDAVGQGSTSPPSQAREDAVGPGGDGVSVRVGAIDGEGFYVEDDGPGVPADDREAIFDVGYTTASDGTGFGLAIVAEIVDAHGWEIDVAEGEAGGARFEVTGVDVEG